MNPLTPPFSEASPSPGPLRLLRAEVQAAWVGARLQPRLLWASAQFRSTVLSLVALGLTCGWVAWRRTQSPGLGAMLGVLVGVLTALAYGLVWLRPHWFGGRHALRLCFAVGLFCGTLGMVLGLREHPVPQPASAQQWLESLQLAAHSGLPGPTLVGMACMLALVLTASQRREQLARELAYARSLAEQEAARREATEARLRLLQAQIQPHFIFNTLAAVQHWVDVGDARASSLLRSLTAFLRGSAELLNQTQVTLAQELPLIEHYLEVMQARWGQRLSYRMDADPVAAAQAVLPPGLVLTLVENAIEHGVAPSLAGAELTLTVRPLPAGGWQLLLDDSGVGLAEGWAEGLGLSNCRARLEHLLPGRARLSLHPHPSGRGAQVDLTVAPTQGA